MADRTVHHAYVKVNGASDAAREQAAAWLAPARSSFRRRTGTHLGNFRWRRPAPPRGCIAQAWSVGEVLRAYVEDVKGSRPTPLGEQREAKGKSPATQTIKTL